MAENLDYLAPFRTNAFGYTENSIVDIELQSVYDGSVNIITTCEGFAPRIVNSRQKFTGNDVEIVVRKADNFDNVYSNVTIDKTLLIPSLSEIVPVLTFVNVIPDSGRLQNGGYKYYFKLKTADGVESPLIEESRLVSIHSGTEFGKAASYIDGTLTRNSVQFTLTNIDTKVYQYVSVYYVRASGEVQPTIKVAYHINKDYEIISNDQFIGSAEITHTGFETETPIAVTDLTAEYSPILTASTLTQKNSRLLLGNITTVSVYDDTLRTAALNCYVLKDPVSSFYTEQNVFNGVATNDPNMIDDTFAKPWNIYHKLGYFPGETYELAINFVFRNGTVSPSYPIMGMDYEQNGTLSYQEFNTALLGTDCDWTTGGQNSYGVVRMKYIPIENTFTKSLVIGKNLSKMNVHTMSIDTTEMIKDNETALRELDVVSYFISRKKRLPDLLMEGLTTLAATAPISSMYPTEMNTYMLGMTAGYGLEGSLAENLVLFPLPGSAMPFSSETLASTDSLKSTFYFDGILYAPLASSTLNKYYAFYSPDITSDTATSSVLSTKNEYYMQISSYLSQSIAYKEIELVRCLGTAKTRYPYCANPYTFSSATNVNSRIKKIKYTDDGIRGFSSMDFTGRLDRQAVLAVYSLLRSVAEMGGNYNGTDYDNVIKRSEQIIFSTTALTGRQDKNYISNNLLAGSLRYESTLPSASLPMSGVKYSPYLGIILDYNALTTGLKITPSATSSYFSGYAENSTMVPANGTTIMGALSRIYTGSGGMLTEIEWKSIYSIERGDNYKAISKRFDISYPLSKYIRWQDAYLQGGDCYSGIYFQRVWRPGGINGIPTANNPKNYISSVPAYSGGETITREGVNITNSGYSIGFPVRSAYNFAIRAVQDVDEIEKKLYGKPRTYTSANPENETHGNRQPETSVINYGNIQDDSVMEYGGFDSSIPYIELNYTNRLVTSDIAITGEFANGYRNFKGLNFKDYDIDLGAITSIISNGLYTFIIYKSGVSLIEVSERSAVTSQNTDTNVYIASADVLPPKSTPIFTTLGSQHLNSVVATDTGVFGVDADARKIWLVLTNDKKIISDNVIQSLLNKLINKDLKDIIGSYDVIFDELTYTFTYNDDTQKSIYYNTRHDTWYGTTDMHKLYQFTVEDRMMSLMKPNKEANVEQPYSLYFPVVNTTTSELFKEVGKTTAIDDRTVGSETKFMYDSYIEFVVKATQLQKFSMSSIIINGNGIPSSIDVIAESLNPYKVNTAPINVSGVEQDTLPMHTNIYMRDAVEADIARIADDDFRFIRTNSANYKILTAGDRLTLDIDGTKQQFTIANITSNSDHTEDTIVLNNPIIAGMITAVYYGWKIPIRLSLGEQMAGKIKLTVPTKKHADLLSGTANTAQNNHVNYSNAKPYGRWIKLRLNFKGIEQIYIDSVTSEIITSYS